MTIVLVAVVHEWQMKRTARTLLVQAEDAQAEDDLEKAASFYAQYCEYVPDDAESAAHMALLMADIAERKDADRHKKMRAYSTLEAQLRRHLERNDIRRRLVDYTILVGRWGDSIDHIKTLLKEKPDDVELLTKLGQCQFALDQNRDAEETLRGAIATDPTAVDAYQLLAMLLRDRMNSSEQADEIINKMIEANPEDAKARRNRIQYISRYYPKEPGVDLAKDPTKAKWLEQRREDINKALALDPEGAETLIIAANLALEDQKPEEARRHLEEGTKLHPDDARFVQNLVSLDVSEKRFDDIAVRLQNGPKTAGLQQLDFDLKLQQRDLAGARKILSTLESDPETPTALKNFMRACLDFHEMKWGDASKKLIEARSVMPSGYAVRIDLMLGKCYEALGEHDREVEVYERAVAEGATVAAHAALAQALMRVGQSERALGELQAVRRHQGTEEFVQSAPARTALLQLLLQRNSRLPEADRNWSDIDEIVAATAKAFPDSPELMLVESNVREQKGDGEGARKLLEMATTKDPKDPRGWLGLARLEFLKGGAAAAIKVLDKCKDQAGDSFALRQASIAYALQLPPEEAKESLKKVDQDLGQFTDDEQSRLKRLIGIAYFRLNDLKESRAAWSSIVEKSPNDAEAQFTLFDIAMGEDDQAEIKKSMASIKNLFGGSSAEAKYVDARVEVANVRAKRSGDPTATLEKARQLVRRAEEQRPKWSVLARFEGEIDVLDNRPDEAIIDLQRALDLGDVDPATPRQLAQLLISRGRGDEARTYLDLANSRGGDSGTSEMLKIGIALADKDIPRAVKLLEEALQAEPDDPQKIVSLAQLLPELGRDDEAERLLRGLVESHSDFPLGWFELIRILKAKHRDDEAREVVLAAEGKLPKENYDLAMAQCYELLGDMPTAEKYFLKARDARPDDLGLARALATFYGRKKDVPKAREQLDRILKAKPANDADREHIAWANREVAVLIAASGTYQDFRAAMGRLQPKDPKAPVSLADKVTMARLLADRPEADSRMEATRLLEEIKNQTNLPPSAQLILARLYQATGNWSRCRDEMLSLLGKAKDDPTYIGTFVEMLLRNNEVDQAIFWLNKLEAIAPDATLTTALRARLLVKQGKTDEAVALLRNLLPRPMPREKVRALVDIANLLEQMDANDAAESMFREYVALDPSGGLVLAGFMGRHGKLKEALDLCQQALELRKVEEVVREGLVALRLHPADATKEDYGRVESWVTKAIAKQPKDLVLQLEYAELLDLQGRYPELEEIYTRLLKNPDIVGVQRAMVLNNLAYLLAVQNKTGDSRKYIDEAINILGPQSDLLDTRALVHLVHGEIKQAVDDLTLAVVDQPSGTKYFHLARACQMNNDSLGAQAALKKATENYELKVGDLPPLEQPIFRKLIDQVGKN
ncbi:MAG TPA: tetratricopeptide repeat protein [Gemmataceae bacterium]|nr:tetratricopeptide repeat protein [Gemmataceae bacterium]